MAQSSNALREPSMEEILASIRRIIEESDVTQPLDEVGLEGRSDEVAAHKEPVVAKPYAAPPDNRDVAETIKTPIESITSEAAVAKPNVKEVPVEKVETVPETARSTVQDELPEALEANAEDDFSSTGSGDDVQAAAAERGSANVNLQPILSQGTEQKVAAAFEDLSYAVMEEQRQSFDEMAREILRPMLQDWLDNNLPSLVERLVREEIERVARGGRR